MNKWHPGWKGWNFKQPQIPFSASSVCTFRFLLKSQAKRKSTRQKQSRIRLKLPLVECKVKYPNKMFDFLFFWQNFHCNWPSRENLGHLKSAKVKWTLLEGGPNMFYWALCCPSTVTLTRTFVRTRCLNVTTSFSILLFPCLHVASIIYENTRLGQRDWQMRVQSMASASCFAKILPEFFISQDSGDGE